MLNFITFRVKWREIIHFYRSATLTVSMTITRLPWVKTIPITWKDNCSLQPSNLKISFLLTDIMHFELYPQLEQANNIKDLLRLFERK